MPNVNFVVGQDKASKIFIDLFRRFSGTDRINVVISETPVPFFDVYHYHRAHLAKCVEANSVITVHHDLDDVDPSISIDKFLPNFKRANTVVCLNSVQQARLANLGVLNTIIIPHGYDEFVFKKKTPPNPSFDDKRILGIVSKRYVRRVKGEAYLFQLLDRLDPDKVAFNLCGNGRLTDAIHMRSLGFDVKVREHLPYNLFQSLYEDIDALLVLSTYEGGPANIPEAIATGTPIITTKVGMAVDMVVEDKNGIFLSGHVHNDAKRIMELLGNENGKFDALLREANNYTPCPTWANVIDQHVNLYSKILEQKA